VAGAGSTVHPANGNTSKNPPIINNFFISISPFLRHSTQYAAHRAESCTQAIVVRLWSSALFEFAHVAQLVSKLLRRNNEARLIVMEIRMLGEKDASNYWALRLEGLQSEPFAFGKSAEEHQATPVEEFAKRFRDVIPGYFNLGAFEGDQLIGIATFMQAPGLKERHKGHIYGVYVTSSHRNKGVGYSLLSALLQKVREDSSVEQILLAVSAHQKDAARLYSKLGFEPFGTEPRSLKIGSDYIDEVHMVLRLR
jgi:GNAT superfamily N-acetyltransferase